MNMCQFDLKGTHRRGLAHVYELNLFYCSVETNLKIRIETCWAKNVQCQQLNQ